MARLLSMPGTGAREGQFSVLQYAAGGGPVHDIGILLFEPEARRFDVMLRGRWEEITDDTEVFEALEDSLYAAAEEMGAGAMLDWFEDSFSNTLRITSRESVALDGFRYTLERLYRERVGEVEVRPFQSHVPLYTLKAAATRFGQDMLAERLGFVPLNRPRQLDERYFAARVVGRSMEPRIPDGSLNLFMHHPVGSRQGKFVLVSHPGVEASYSVKQYTRRGDRVVMVPLNPEFEPFDLGPEHIIVAEWIEVLD